VLENKVIRKIFASTHEEVTEEWGQKVGNHILKTSKILLFINCTRTINQEKLDGLTL